MTPHHLCHQTFSFIYFSVEKLVIYSFHLLPLILLYTEMEKKTKGSDGDFLNETKYQNLKFNIYSKNEMSILLLSSASCPCEYKKSRQSLSPFFRVDNFSPYPLPLNYGWTHKKSQENQERITTRYKLRIKYHFLLLFWIWRLLAMMMMMTCNVQ